MRFQRLKEPLSFLDFADPIFSSTADFMGDNWIFQYAYGAKESDSLCSVFKRDPAAENSSNVFIDVHLTHSGTATGTTVERKTDYQVLNMSALRYGI